MKSFLPTIGLLIVALFAYNPLWSQAISVNSTITNASCEGVCDGEIQVTASGGSGNYLFNWSNGSSGTILSGACAGSYTLTVSENVGSPFSWSFVQTGENMTIIIGAGAVLVDGVLPTTNDKIGVFAIKQGNEYCGNYSTAHPSQAISLSPWGSDNFIPVTQFSFGDAFHFKFYRASDGREIDLTPTFLSFHPGWGNLNTTYSPNGMAMITSLVGTSTPVLSTIETYDITAAYSISVGGSVTHETVQGQSDGSIVLNVAGGIAPYQYLWNTGATTANLTGIQSGSYTVTVTDANICPATQSFTVDALASIYVTGTVTHAYCATSQSGAITAEVIGGTAPYQYSWNNGGSTQTISNLAVGSYSVTIEDADGFIVSNTFSVQAQYQIVLSGSVQGVACETDFSGSINTQVNNGQGQYSFNWSNGASTQNLSEIGIGSYTLTVSDVNNCIATQVYQISATNPIVIEEEIQHETCIGFSNGSISLNTSGGTTPYSYVWSNQIIASQITNAAPGNYSVTVSDLNGCEISSIFSVNEAEPLLVNANLNHVSCYESNNGSIFLNVSGGLSPYSYSWNNGSSNAQIFNLPADNYSVTVMDNNQCSIIDNFIVSEPDALVAEESVQHVSCYGGSDASIEVFVSGGTSPYSYLWSNGATTSSISNLTQGSYQLTVSDANNCNLTIPYSIMQAALISLHGSLNNIDCHGVNDGSINLTIINGVSPFSIIWSNGATTEDLNNLVAGTYSVTVTDNNLCTANASYTLFQPNPILLSSNITTPSYMGASDAGIAVSVSGGTSPYSYLWNSGGISANLTNVIAGSYNLSVTDFNNCLFTETFIIEDGPEMLIIESEIVNESCASACNGSIALSVTGGNGLYNYLWNTGSTESQLSNLCPGNYSVLIEENMSSPFWSYIETGLNMTIGVFTNGILVDGNPITANDYLGVFYETPNGLGCAGYYSWNPSQLNVAFPAWGANSQGGNFPGLAVGELLKFKFYRGSDNREIDLTPSFSNPTMNTFQVQGMTLVTSLIGTSSASLSETASFTIQEGNFISIVAQLTPVSVFGGNDGAISINPSGGILPYSFIWSNGQTSSSISGLFSGNYSVTVYDAIDCSSIVSYTINEPAGFDVQSLVEDVICYGDNTGAVVLTIQGGQAPIVFDWSNGDTSQNLINATAGNYTVTITDASQFQEILSFTISQGNEIFIDAGLTQILCNGDANGAIDITISGGTLPYGFAWSNQATSEDLSSLLAGLYEVTLSDANDCMLTAEFEILEPSALMLAADLTQILCNGDASGAIDITISGGTLPYGFAWSNQAISEDLSGLLAGLYEVTVSDANDCMLTTEFEILEPSALMLDADLTQILCNGGSDGAIDITISGGTQPYLYSWSNGSADEDLSMLSAGVYTLTLSDANGCNIDITLQLVEPSILTAQISSNPVSCFGYNDGSISLIASGGAGSYSLLWDNGSTSFNLNNLAPGGYAFTLTDANSCTSTGMASIDEPSALDIDYTSENISCFGAFDGYIGLQGSGGTPPYQYVWSNGLNASERFNLGPGTYFATVTDSEACLQNISVTIIQPTQLVVNSTVQAVSNFGGSDGSVAVLVTGGEQPYSYLWSTMGTDSYLENIPAGTYDLTVTDANSCVKTHSVQITQPAGTPNWQVMNTGIVHEMIIPSGIPASLDGIALIDGDYLGVFYQDQGDWICGGFIAYSTIQTDTFMIYGAQPGLNNGFQTNQEFVWKVWKLMEDTEYFAAASYAPVNPPDITHQGLFAEGGISQVETISTNFQSTLSFNLTANWNIVSINVLPNDLSLAHVLSSVHSHINLVKDENGGVYWPSFNINFIGDWELEEGYQIRMNQAAVMTISGSIFNPDTLDINLPFGWSFIGYPRLEPAAIADLLQPITSDIIIVKNQFGSVYWPSFGLNLIVNMIPGQGYQINMASSDVFYFPDNDNLFSKSYLIEDDFNYFESPIITENNMTIGIPEQAWGRIPSLNSEIAVVDVNGLVVGRSIYRGDMLAVPVWGSDSYSEIKDGLFDREIFKIVVYDFDMQKEFEYTIFEWLQGDGLYKANSIQLVRFIDASSQFSTKLIDAYPNPARHLVSFTFELAEEGEVKLNLFNILGEEVASILKANLPAGLHQFEYSVNHLNSAVYFYQLETKNTKHTKQLVVQ